MHKNIYEYKRHEDWIEIRRKDGKDINYEDDDLEAEEFNEYYYNNLIHWNREDLANDYKNTCSSKVHLIKCCYYEIIDSDEIKNYSSANIFIVIDND